MEHLTKRARKLCKQGKVLYKVYAFPEKYHAFIVTIEPLTKPYLTRLREWFIDCKVTYEGEIESYVTRNSLKDMNLIPNSYNDHRTFSKLKHAEKYKRDVIDGLYTKPKIKLWGCTGVSNNAGTEGIVWDAVTDLDEHYVIGEPNEYEIYKRDTISINSNRVGS